MSNDGMVNKVVLVTGGGTGIGKSAAVRCARKGAKVAVNYAHSRQEAESTVSELRELGTAASAYCADVGHDSEVREMFARIEAELGLVDYLVSNAGVTRFVPYDDLEALTDEVWDSILAVNLKGTFHCARAAALHMRKSGHGGAMVIVSSTAAVSGHGSSIAYAASKGALITLTKSLALAFAPGIRVNGVAPSVVETRWTAGWDEFKRKSLSETPLARIATPDDVSEVIVSLLDSASFLTGQTIVVDGGRYI